MEEHPYPITVQGGWTPDQSKAVKNKLQLYFQSKKKSNGGECRVEAEDGAARATVHFKSEEVRERVLARENHEVTLENESLKLHLFSQSIPPKSDDVSDVSKDSPDSKGGPGTGGSGADKEEAQAVQSLSVVLDNVSDSMSRDCCLCWWRTCRGWTRAATAWRSSGRPTERWSPSTTPV
uniref:protein mono-ADP-ribosyltransferase PARP14-like n=1 Tax=Centroberyx gerrardi TaxID=166262 RepID=UPI003AAE6F4C